MTRHLPHLGTHHTTIGGGRGPQARRVSAQTPHALREELGRDIGRLHPTHGDAAVLRADQPADGESYCHLERYLALAPAGEGADLGVEALARRLADAIREADARLAVDDHPGALTALDVAVVWQAREPQSFARLVEAWLTVAPADRFATTLVLATYVAIHDAPLDGSGASELPLPGHVWPAARLAALRDRAAARLDDAAPPEALRRGGAK